jgi:hypothetical protein
MELYELIYFCFDVVIFTDMCNELSFMSFHTSFFYLVAAPLLTSISVIFVKSL